MPDDEPIRPRGLVEERRPKWNCAVAQPAPGDPKQPFIFRRRPDCRNGHQVASARATAPLQARARGLDEVIAFAVGENIVFCPEPSAMWLECMVGNSTCAP
jgi:hypothetical protein